MNYQEHYMRVFVKDERKFDAAMYAFNETCKKFNEQFKKGSSDIKVRLDKKLNVISRTTLCPFHP